MLLDIDQILFELSSIPDYDDQIGLQTVKNMKDPFYATGSILNKDHSENEFTEFLFNIPYVNSIISELKMYRTRLMKMKPKTCYSYHQDYTKRIHIPLITNDKCFFVIDDEIIRCPANGNYYLIDTTKMHTFVNASFDYRLHIVGCVND